MKDGIVEAESTKVEVREREEREERERGGVAAVGEKVLWKM